MDRFTISTAWHVPFSRVDEFWAKSEAEALAAASRIWDEPVANLVCRARLYADGEGA